MNHIVTIQNHLQGAQILLGKNQNPTLGNTALDQAMFKIQEDIYDALLICSHLWDNPED